MKKVLIALGALILSTDLYAGWTTGGISGMTVGPKGELLMGNKDLKEKLAEAALNGVITLPSDEGLKELVPSAFDFKKNLYHFRDPETNEQVVLKNSDLDISN